MAKKVKTEEEPARASGAEALICYNLRANRIEWAEGQEDDVRLTRFALGATLCHLAVYKHNHSKTNEFARTGRGAKEFLHLFTDILTVFKDDPAFLFLLVRPCRMYGLLDRLFRDAIEHARSIEDKNIDVVCKRFSLRGVCEVIACLCKTKDRSIIVPLMEREKRNILKDEEGTLPRVPREEKRGRGRPPKVRDLDMDSVEKAAMDLDQQSKPLELELIALFQHFLDELRGKAFPNYEDNRKLAELVQERADRIGVTLLCWDLRKDRNTGELIGDGDTHPVRLYCEEPDSKSGMFRARFGPDSRPIYSGPLFPQLLTWLGKLD